MIIAQITDTHIRDKGKLAYGVVDAAGFLARAVEHLRRLRPIPDVVLATGDLVDAGLPEEYRHLRELLAPLPMPVYLIPGNHDDRQVMAQEFAGYGSLPREGFLQYVVEDHPVRLIALDTLIPGKGGGLLCEERLVWLATRLAEAPRRPTVIFMHHPPFMTGIRGMDKLNLTGAEAMAEIVRRHPQVERVVCGHVHRPVQVRWGGTVASIAPSTAHQVWLDLSGEGAWGFVMEPPALHLHFWRPETGLITHTSYIGDFGGPRAFKGGAPIAA